MALRLCARCDRHVRDGAACPYCGAHEARAVPSLPAGATRVAMLFGAGAMSVAAAAGVSCSAVYGAPGGPGWDAAPATPLPEAAPLPRVDSGGAVPRDCYHESAALALVGVAPSVGAMRCSEPDALEFRAACLSNAATYEACSAVIEKNKPCARCLFGALPGTPADTTSIGAVVQTSDNDFAPNVWSCAALMLGLPECAVKVTRRAVCVSSSCARCAEAEQKDCQGRATAGICRDTVDAACEAALAAGEARWKPVCEGATFDESYAKVAAFLCGAGPGADAGPRDAAPE
ncbi:MAG TPA: hypothetical protein PLR99_13300 [Polyangiaceae bacterium]|nr:hypothetical protein [Polyangiaceae bacterium]